MTDSERSVDEAPLRHPVELAIKNSLEPGKGYLIAVSGGGDSMALLSGVLALKEEMSLSLGVAHVDHGQRECSSLDLALVKGVAESNNIPFYLHTLGEQPKSTNFEQWAREERYGFFSKCLEEKGYDQVLVAHHQDDNLETFLIRLLANKEPTAIRSHNPRSKILRPLLDLKSEVLIDYLTVNSIPYRDDPTNSDPRFLRNRIRHTLLPFLQENFGEESIEALTNQASEIDEHYRAIDIIARDYLSSLDLGTFGSKPWRLRLIEELNKVPAPLGERLIRHLFTPITGKPLGNRALKQVMNFFLEGQVGVQIEGGIELRRYKGGIAVSSPLNPNRIRCSTNPL